MTTPTLSEQRHTAVQAALADIRPMADAPDRAALARIASRLEQLAAYKELFPNDEYAPPPAAPGTGGYRIYRLNPEDGQDRMALYLNAINPGEKSIPHNHSTWAVIVAIQGQERHRVFRRLDDGSDPAVAKLTLEREFTVQPGHAIGLLTEELHSIHAVGALPLLHFHLYGRPLETQTERIGVDPETGAVVNYTEMLRALTKATV